MKKVLIIVGVIIIIGGLVFLISRNTEVTPGTIPKSVQSQLPIEEINYRIEMRGDALKITLRPKPLRVEEEAETSLEDRYQISEYEALSVIYSLGMKDFTGLKIEWVRE